MGAWRGGIGREKHDVDESYAGLRAVHMDVDAYMHNKYSR